MRMRELIVLALFAAFCPAATRAEEQSLASLATRTQGIDWPSFLGPERNARSPETGLARDWTGRTPRIVWQCPLGESYGAPSISGGRLVHFDRVENAHRVTCRNAETGDELWYREFPADYVDMLGYNKGPRATPIIDEDRVYVVTPEGGMHCVQLADGNPVWDFDATKQFGVVKNFFGVASTPIVFGDLLIANIGGSPEGGPPNVYAAGGRVLGNGTGVVAFDKHTGEVRWKATDELASYASPVIAEIDGRSYCFVLARGGLVALDPRSGAVDFQFPWRATKLESVNASTPAVVDDEVFISESYGPGSALLNVVPTPAADTDASQVVWQDELRSRDHALDLHWNTPVVHDGYLYASSGQHSNEAELRCVEWKTGKVQWREPGLGRSSLLYVDGCLLCLSEDGALRLLRATPEKYDVLADLTPRDAAGEPLLDSPAWAAPVLAHGLLYVRGASRLVCLELIPQDAAVTPR